MQELFGNDGIAMKLSRHTVGQSDLTPISIGAWSYDETSGDTELSDFSLQAPGEAMAGWLRRMMDVASDITLLGSIWSPPVISTFLKLRNSHHLFVETVIIICYTY